MVGRTVRQRGGRARSRRQRGSRRPAAWQAAWQRAAAGVAGRHGHRRQLCVRPHPGTHRSGVGLPQLATQGKPLVLQNLREGRGAPRTRSRLHVCRGGRCAHASMPVDCKAHMHTCVVAACDACRHASVPSEASRRRQGKQTAAWLAHVQLCSCYASLHSLGAIETPHSGAAAHCKRGQQTTKRGA